MHEFARVVEILVQILQNAPVSWDRILPPPPLEMKIVRDDGNLDMSWQKPQHPPTKSWQKLVQNTPLENKNLADLGSLVKVDPEYPPPPSENENVVDLGSLPKVGAEYPPPTFPMKT